MYRYRVQVKSDDVGIEVFIVQRANEYLDVWISCSKQYQTLEEAEEFIQRMRTSENERTSLKVTRYINY